MKRFLSLLCATVLFISLSACKDSDFDNYISGVSLETPQTEYEGELFRYENPVLGIILEYPAEFTRIGNFDVDGHISFRGSETEVFIYSPDKERSNLRFTVEEYALDILGLEASDNSGVVTYGKTTGYRTYATIDGRTVIQFVVKGVDGFYRFDYATTDAAFSENDHVFLAVMSSIRIDDGIYTSLNKLLAENRLLLEYATSMQYVTDADYANHCLNSYETSGNIRHLNNAKSTFLTIKSNLSQISAHTPKGNENFAEQWNNIVTYANEKIEACDDALAAIEAGNIEEAQRLCRVAFPYDLSEAADKYIIAISTEIGEY